MIVVTQARQVMHVERQILCPKCHEQGNEVPLVWNHISLTTNPPMFPHVCNVCQYVETVRGVTYPHEVTVPVGEWQDEQPD